jgi:large subunit ribosomal protein L4
MKVDVFDTSGEKVGKIKLPEEIFAAKVNKNLMGQAVRVYLANQRQWTASTKTRGEIVGSRRKIWRQKGTGRARHGDRYAPIFVGGGVAHGPKPKKLKLALPKKMRRRALFSALTSQLERKAIIIVEGMEKIEDKTAAMIEVLKNLNLKTKNSKLKEKVLLVLPEKLPTVMRAARNLAKLELALASLLNTYQVLNNEKLVFLKPSIKVLEKIFIKSKSTKSEAQDPKRAR